MKKLLLSFLAVLSSAMLASAGSENVTPDQAEKLLKEKKDIVVLDVRTPEEFKSGHIAGAKNVDFMADDFKKQVEALDKSKTYLLHCASGGRSTRALKILDEDKFSQVYHLNGGFSAWKEAGKPVAK
ncbi:MAG TPA: rhodanese-like domain-containing protein [Chthoniobacteraceae bacterium]|nr:rhodanese-like domain-containing protein [Chthoniobacteraceae bacterium]